MVFHFSKNITKTTKILAYFGVTSDELYEVPWFNKFCSDTLWANVIKAVLKLDKSESGQIWKKSEMDIYHRQ